MLVEPSFVCTKRSWTRDADISRGSTELHWILEYKHKIILLLIICMRITNLANLIKAFLGWIFVSKIFKFSNFLDIKRVIFLLSFISLGSVYCYYIYIMFSFFQYCMSILVHALHLLILLMRGNNCSLFNNYQRWRD